MARLNTPKPMSAHGLLLRPSTQMGALAKIILLVALSWLASSTAVELPLTSIIAINPVDDGDSLDAGGSAVLIDQPNGLALTLIEVLPEAKTGDQIEVVLAGGIRRAAEITRIGSISTGILLHIRDLPPNLQAMPLADSRQVNIGDAAMSLGNPFDALSLDGLPALSRGIISGHYHIPEDAPPVRGRRGAVLSTYRGEVFETDAAVNDGNQGGAMVDHHGQLIALCSLGVARQRKIGTAIPIHILLEDLQLPLTTHPPAAHNNPIVKALVNHAKERAAGVALIYFHRPMGPGNPNIMPRPRPIDNTVPKYQRKNLQRQWDMYYHQQQVLFTDQAVPALIIDSSEGLLLTAVSHLHGDANSGKVLNVSNTSFEVLAIHKDLDLALLKTDKPLNQPELTLCPNPHLHSGDPIALIGKHRNGGPFTVTTGIVSATDRRLNQQAYPFHQTDALGNYGNLGGPLIDAHGRVVGMLAHMGPQANYHWKINSGVAMFIDSETILKVLPDLKAGTSITDRQIVGLGVALDWSKDAGSTIANVQEGSGAEAAGLQEGDRIISLDNRPATDLKALRRVLVRKRIGDQVTMVIERDGATQTVQVELSLL